MPSPTSLYYRSLTLYSSHTGLHLATGTCETHLHLKTFGMTFRISMTLLILLEHSLSTRSFFHHPHLKSYGTFTQWAPLAISAFQSHSTTSPYLFFILCIPLLYHSFPGGSEVKNPPAEVGDTWVWSLGWEGPLEEEMATDSNNLSGRIPWREEPVGLQSTGSQRVEHIWASEASTSL